MNQILFWIAAGLFWACSLLSLIPRQRKLELTLMTLEKIALLTFTAALVVYISKLQIVNGEAISENYDRPVSYLLFAWSICIAHLVTEVAYDNRITSVFANFWAAVSLTLSPAMVGRMRPLFNSGLEWLSFHRICFLLGYAFCALAFPLILFYFWKHLREPEAKDALWRLDRMAYRMVLWSLPLLTAGIVAEALLFFERGHLSISGEWWAVGPETFLALAAWFLCGVYLHMRLFFGWKNLRAATLYLSGLVLILAGHLAQGFYA